jgi:GNAT superfamily N-acetyltransferase
MPEIEIRPATAEDIPALAALDTSYSSDYVWQMEIQVEEAEVNVFFREVRLPRSVRVDYPRSMAALGDTWSGKAGMLVAALEGRPAAFISLTEGSLPATAWITDLVVERRLRQQGIGAALVLAAQDWASRRGHRQIVMEMQPKNYPAICLARKLGYDFCGFNDRFYANHEIALFFARPLR